MKLPVKVLADEMASLVGYTDRRLRQLADEGYFPKPIKCNYLLGETIRGLLRHASEAKSPALERLNEAKLEAQQRKNRIAQKMELREYMETSDVSDILGIGIKSLELIPTKIESEFALPAAVTKRLEQLMDEARADWVKQIKAMP